MNAKQLREYIVRPALKSIGLHSDAAENLLMGTAAQESHLEYVQQLGDGPAVGLFQMEPMTHLDIWHNYLAFNQDLAEEVLAAIEFRVTRRGETPSATRMVWDFRYAAIMCRLHYRRVPKALPAALDVWAQAEYWKEHYNTHLGAGTVQEFVDNYRRIS